MIESLECGCIDSQGIICGGDTGNPPSQVPHFVMLGQPEESLLMSSLEERLRPAIITLIVGIHLGLCVWGGLVHSPTADEPAYLVSGISHWQLGNFELCRVSPPLVRLMAALPVMAAEPRYDWGSYQSGPAVRREHAVGRDFLIANGKRSFWLFTLGRWACLPFTLMGAWISYRWARDLFGQSSAYVALLLWCFSPNILAHAQMLTPDTGVTALCLASCYTFWRWSRSLSLLDAVTWGAVLGCAVLAKTNAIVLFPGLVIGFAFDVLLTRKPGTQRSLWHLLAGFGTAICLINLGYGFQGSFRPLGKYVFASQIMAGDTGSNRFRGTLLESIPVPLPAPFLEGIDLQKVDFENAKGHFKTYFRGRWYDHGWWWYYLYVVGVKVPEGTWALIVAGAIVILVRRPNERITILSYAVVPCLLLFALPSAQTGFGHSLRYVLPAFPFAFVIASAAAVGNRVCKLLAATALVGMTCSSLPCCPHSLSYFNVLAGGPRNGHFHLLDGNLDWGQDLLFVIDWIEKHPEATPVYASSWGPLPTSEMGIALAPPATDQDGRFPPGYYLISVNHLHGGPRHNRPELQGFLSLPVDERIAYSIHVYHLQDRSPTHTIEHTQQNTLDTTQHTRTPSTHPKSNTTKTKTNTTSSFWIKMLGAHRIP